jgi:hypothetical protein
MNGRKLGWAIFIIFFAWISGNATINRTFIDFSKYDQVIQQQYSTPADSVITNVDGQPKLIIGYKDYLLSNWKVELNESAQDIQNRILSYCKSVQSQRFGATLGVRVHFPQWNNTSYALIKPPFPIKIYDTNGQYANAENGVMPNVADIKSISIWVNGRNFKMGLAIRLRDRNENIHEFFFGYLQFDGWRKLVFSNPNFSDNIMSKVLQREPLYPYDIPYLVFDSLVIYKPSDTLGGDFVTYFGSVEMEYTPYIIDPASQDIKDEEVWSIITKKLLNRQAIEDQRLTENLYLYQQERTREQSQTDNLTMTNK